MKCQKFYTATLLNLLLKLIATIDDFRTYGDRVTVSDVVAMRNLVSDAGEHMVKAITKSR